MASITIPLQPLSAANFIKDSSIPAPDFIRATSDSTLSTTIVSLFTISLDNTSLSQSIIPKGPHVKDLNVFKVRVLVLVASDANKTSLLKTTKTPLL